MITQVEIQTPDQADAVECKNEQTVELSLSELDLAAGGTMLHIWA